MVALTVQRTGSCRSGGSDRCAQWFAYDWDEQGQLAEARRWDFDGGTIPGAPTDPSVVPAPPTSTPSWDVHYAYTMGQRVVKTSSDGTSETSTLEIFDTLRVEHAGFDNISDYDVTSANEHAYLGGMAHAYDDTTAPHPTTTFGPLVMNLAFGDHLGSTSVAVDHASSEVTERTSYYTYGATEADYRPTRWNSFRENYRFTGKEEDIEVGATYFGARYYQPYLGMWLSPDPLTIHGLGGDLNPYAYVRGMASRAVDPFGLDECGADDAKTVTCPNGATVTRLPDADGQPQYEIVQDAAPRAQQPTAQTAALADGSAAPADEKQDASPGAAFAHAADVALGFGSGQRHLSMGGSNYITRNGVRKSVVNSLVRGAVPPFLPSFAVPDVFAASSDPNDKSNAVGHIGGVVLGAVLGGAASSLLGAAEGLAPSSRALGVALEDSGFVRAPGEAAHHIVAGTAEAAAPARAVLQKFGIGINEAVNGVFLPGNLAAENAAGAAVHSTLHTNAYYTTVNMMLGAATTRAEALEALAAIRQSLLSGGL